MQIRCELTKAEYDELQQEIVDNNKAVEEFRAAQAQFQLRARPLGLMAKIYVARNGSDPGALTGGISVGGDGVNFWMTADLKDPDPDLKPALQSNGIPTPKSAEVQ